MQKHQFELLAPGGDMESIKAAIFAGANAIYCGLDNFNARNRAKNLSFDELNGVLKLAHEHGCQVFLTLNIIILEHEFKALFKLLNKLVNTHVDAVIVQDIGLFHLLAEHFPSLVVHASTQVTTHNEGQLAFFNQLKVRRLNLSRELDIAEIKQLCAKGHELNIESEVFVHGSYCLGFSGLCYISSVHGGNSGNRGRCSQPCRDQYETTEQGKDFPLNLKDNSAFLDLEALAEAKVDSLKIEGRIKDFHYVYTVVNAWRQQLERFSASQELSTELSPFYKVFNRDLSNGFLSGLRDKHMFIDNPRNYAYKHFAKLEQCSSEQAIKQVKQGLYDDKTAEMHNIRQHIAKMDAELGGLCLEFSGQEQQKLQLRVELADRTLQLSSDSLLLAADKHQLDALELEARFKNITSPDYRVGQIDCSALAEKVFLPFKEVAAMKKTLLKELFASREADDKQPIKAVTLPKLEKQQNNDQPLKPVLIIDSKRDLALLKSCSGPVYFKLPDSMDKQVERYIQMFQQHEHLLPYFPAVLIAEDYEAALLLLTQLKPKRIISNNSGIAFQAYRLGIEWIAGPHFNLVNSYSLLALQQRFKCSGAFISNELKQKQIKYIKRPENFELYYSIYHPIMLLSSRQCLFQQTLGCEKQHMDELCLSKCKKSTQLINIKGTGFSINKQVGRHGCIYNNEDFLNLDIVAELPELFTGFAYDLSRVENPSRQPENNALLNSLFESFIRAANTECKQQLEQLLPSTTAQQYRKGL